jgi:hypothetical protein
LRITLLSKIDSAASNYSQWAAADCRPKSIGGHTNEKDIPDHSNSAAIGGLGGCTEHIEFTQQLTVNNTQYINISFFNFIQSIHNNSRHKFNHKPELGDFNFNLERQFIHYH